MALIEGLPVSKSIANRRLILSALGGFESAFLPPDDFLPNDVLVLKRLLASDDAEFDAEDAGTAYRFMLAYLAGKPGMHYLTGSPRLLQRPIAPLVDALTTLGGLMMYEEKEGYGPLIINGMELYSHPLTVDSSLSSQFISALMLIAPTIPGGLTFHITKDIPSFPYVLMTAACLKLYGVETIMNENRILVREAALLPAEERVEADWSSAAFWYALCAVTGKEFEFSTLKLDSIQGDKKAAIFFSSIGVQTTVSASRIKITNTGIVKENLSFDLKDHPDIAPPLITACALKKIDARFYGLENLKHKESDRTAILQRELKKTGVKFEENGDHWQLDTSELAVKEVSFNPENDHRIALSMACFKALETRVNIEDQDCVKKSYPKFWEDFKIVFL
jgi:3-phosphoshikimate 1-carboxyvinyltransferase